MVRQPLNKIIEKISKKLLTNEKSYDILKCAYIKGLFFVVQK